MKWVNWRIFALWMMAGAMAAYLWGRPDVAMFVESDVRNSIKGIPGAIHDEDRVRGEIDRYISTLPFSDVRFNRLEAIPYDEPETITVVITPPGEEVSEVPLLGRNGKIEVHKVALATQIEAELTTIDDDVEIRPTAARQLLLRPKTPVDLSWQVNARRTKPFVLELVLTNRVVIEGREVVDRTAFRQRFEVKVSGLRRAALWIDDLDPLFKLLGGLASMIAVGALMRGAWSLVRQSPESGSGGSQDQDPAQ